MALIGHLKVGRGVAEDAATDAPPVERTPVALEDVDPVAPDEVFGRQIGRVLRVGGRGGVDRPGFRVRDVAARWERGGPLYPEAQWDGRVTVGADRHEVGPDLQVDDQSKGSQQRRVVPEHRRQVVEVVGLRQLSAHLLLAAGEFPRLLRRGPAWKPAKPANASAGVPPAPNGRIKGCAAGWWAARSARASIAASSSRSRDRVRSA